MIDLHVVVGSASKQMQTNNSRIWDRLPQRVEDIGGFWLAVADVCVLESTLKCFVIGRNQHQQPNELSRFQSLETQQLHALLFKGSRGIFAW